MIESFSFYISDGTKTLPQICKDFNLSIEQVIEANSQISLLLKGYSVRKYLNSLLPNDKVMKDLEIRIPQKPTGGLDRSVSSLIHSLETRNEKYSNPNYISTRDLAYDDYDYSNPNYISTRSLAYDDRDYSNTDYLSPRRLAYRKTNERGSVNLPRNPGNSSVIDFGEFDCFFNVYQNGVSQGAWELPVYPQEFSDTNSAVFVSQSLLGRSVDYQIYQGSARTVSFTLNLHEELVPHDLDYIHKVVARIESCCYPGYSSGTVKPPEISFTMGRQFKVRGILEGCSANWKSPMIRGKLVNCDLSISIKETTGPYSGQQIRSMRGYR